MKQRTKLIKFLDALFDILAFLGIVGSWILGFVALGFLVWYTFIHPL